MDLLHFGTFVYVERLRIVSQPYSSHWCHNKQLSKQNYAASTNLSGQLSSFLETREKRGLCCVQHLVQWIFKGC